MFSQSPNAGGGVAESALEVYLLGRTDFDASLALQERLLFELAEQRNARGYAIICEHAPMITVGRQGSWAHVEAEVWDAEGDSLPVRWVNRGGGCLVHGPGQLAVYPLIPLQRRSWGLSDYLRRLHASLLDVTAEFGVKGWVDATSQSIAARQGTFAFLGVAVRNWMSHHGFFLNVSPDPMLQRLTRPLAFWKPGVGQRSNGPVPARISSLAMERGRAVNMHAVREAVVRLLAQHLGFARYHVYGGHPCLQPARRPPHVLAARA